MSANLEAKKVIVADIVEKMKNAESLVICSYSGLTVEQVTQLRKNCRENDVHYCVLKNRLVARALKELNIEGRDHLLEGPNAFVFGEKDVTAAPKMIQRFLTACDLLGVVSFLFFMVLLFFYVQSYVRNAFQLGLAHGLLNLEMVGAFQREQQVLVERDGKITHRAAALADPTAFGCGQGAFYGVDGAPAIGFRRVEEHKEVAVAVVLQMAQPDADFVEAQCVVDGHVEGDTVLLCPLRLGNHGAFVERVAGAGRKSQ